MRIGIAILTGLILQGCPGPSNFTLKDINTGVTVGRTFHDNGILDPGQTVWGVNTVLHFARDGK